MTAPDPVQLQLRVTGIREALAAAAERSAQPTPRNPGDLGFRRAADPALLTGSAPADRPAAVDPAGFAALLPTRP